MSRNPGKFCRDFFLELCTFLEVKVHDIIIIGGGLAGLTAALDLSRYGYDVVVFEPDPYPHHRVCGEYVSNEVVPYLRKLGIDLPSAGAVVITEFQISTINGHIAKAKLPLGGMGISRYALDNLLYEKAREQQVKFIFSKVSGVHLGQNRFHVTTEGESFAAKVVIGAYGKRSALDKTLQRNFIYKKQPWLAVKGHFHYEGIPEHQVALHNFEGGYGGLSKIETGAVNFCYLTSYDSFKKHGGIERFNKNVVSENRHLSVFLNEAKPVFENPLTIAQISFEKKEPLVDHILMCGDTAGLIHPLCGNGMAMAIHSAKMASEGIRDFMEKETYDRMQMENEYVKNWNRTFKRRLWYGRRLQYMLLNKKYMAMGVSAIGASPGLLRNIITKTHGKPIV